MERGQTLCVAPPRAHTERGETKSIVLTSRYCAALILHFNKHVSLKHFKHIFCFLRHEFIFAELIYSISEDNKKIKQYTDNQIGSCSSENVPNVNKYEKCYSKLLIIDRHTGNVGSFSVSFKK